MIFVRGGIIRPSAEDARAAVVEFLLTTAFMASVFSLVRWGIGTMAPGAPAAELRVRVVAVSASVGLLIVGIAMSRPGRFSGAHMNPAITLGLFAAGAVQARRVLPYLTAQGSGSIVAAMLTRLLWGPSVGAEPVKWGVVRPGNGWSGSAVAVAEAATLAAIVAVMCAVTTRWLLVGTVGALFGLQGAILGTLTGGSANPARQLGPALFSGEVHLLAVYLIAPVVGGMLAGWGAVHVGSGRRLRTSSGIGAAGGSEQGPVGRPSIPSATTSRPGMGQVDDALVASRRPSGVRVRYGNRRCRPDS